MQALLPIVIGLLMLATLGVLLLGFLSMAKGGDFNKKYGNILMQARVGLQAAAVFLLVVLAFLSSKS